MTEEKQNVESCPVDPGRRDFICKSALACCVVGMPLARNALAEEEKPGKSAPAVNAMELISYCGLYCGACDIYQKRISKHGNELRNVLDAMEFESWAHTVPGLQEYDAFYKTLNTLIMFFGQCMACMKGGGNPMCKIRICCKEKGYTTCADCKLYPCEEVKQVLGEKSLAYESVEKIRKDGLKKWAKKQQEKVDKGFRASTYLLEQKNEPKAF